MDWEKNLARHALSLMDTWHEIDIDIQQMIEQDNLPRLVFLESPDQDLWEDQSVDAASKWLYIHHLRSRY